MLLLIISLIVLALIFISFVPHIYHAWLDKGTREISLHYLLFNAICSTEHLLMVFFYTINLHIDSPIDLPIDIPTEAGYWTHNPRNALDWVNFVQVLGVWVLWNILLGLNLYHRPTNRLRKPLIVVIYFGFLMISIGPVIADAVSDIFCPPHHPNCPQIERDPIALFHGLHFFILLPFLTTIPLVIGIVKQARIPLQTHNITGLKFQAVAFTLSAVAWVPRVSVPWDLYLDGTHPIILVINAWYHMVGFVIVDDAVFALGQGIFLWLSLRQIKRAEERERQPLLE